MASMSPIRSKILLVACFFVLFAGGRFFWMRSHSLIRGGVEMESYVPAIPEGTDAENGDFSTLSYGYQIAPWPRTFQGDPIVTTMEYRKGPPSQFISEMVQVWSPGEVEVSIEGPRTPVPGMSAVEWKSCLRSAFCLAKKEVFARSAFKDLLQERDLKIKFFWFEGETIESARGVRAEIKLGDSLWERYVVIGNTGVTQNFTLKAKMGPALSEARDRLRQVIRGMRVGDGISEARDWIAVKLRGIDLSRASRIPDPKARYLKLISIQNLLFSQLSVDPRDVAPFFHLAGVTHILGMSLLKEKKTYFKNQESWINRIQPLMSTLLEYAGDFPEAGKEKGERKGALANMDSLLQDYLLLKQKLSK